MQIHGLRSVQTNNRDFDHTLRSPGFLEGDDGGFLRFGNRRWKNGKPGTLSPGLVVMVVSDNLAPPASLQDLGGKVQNGLDELQIVIFGFEMYPLGKGCQ